MNLSQIIENHPEIFMPIDAVALFGSAIRGDTDKFSDIDTLLVSSDLNSLKFAKQYLLMYGYSCSCYSWNRLNSMIKMKALFIQHLKQESYIIKDKKFRLNNLLTSYIPSDNYDIEIEHTKKLMSITKLFPDNPLGIGWTLDVLSVGFRNLAILSLANCGQYVFSYRELIEELIRKNYIEHQSKNQLLKLRKYKAFYRNRKFCDIPKKEFVLSIQSLLSSAFEIDIKPRVVSDCSFQKFCLFSEEYIMSNSWYLKTRLCEGAFLSWLGLSTLCKKQHNGAIFDILNIITNPSCYNYYSNTSEGNLRSKVINLIFHEKKNAA